MGVCTKERKGVTAAVLELMGYRGDGSVARKRVVHGGKSSDHLGGPMNPVR